MRCTKKLQTAIGLKKSDLVESEVEIGFTSWHLNLIEIDGCSCLLVTAYSD
ncbi:MAG: DUF6933 domain-containing protein [Methylobacter sp.]